MVKKRKLTQVRVAMIHAKNTLEINTCNLIKAVMSREVDVRDKCTVMIMKKVLLDI